MTSSDFLQETPKELVCFDNFLVPESSFLPEMMRRLLSFRLSLFSSDFRSMRLSTVSKKVHFVSDSVFKIISIMQRSRPTFLTGGYTRACGVLVHERGTTTDFQD